MQTIKLYKYTRPDGGITVSPVIPDCEYTQMYRLVADEGKALTCNEAFASKNAVGVYGWFTFDCDVADNSKLATLVMSAS